MLSSNDSYYLPVLAKAAIFFFSSVIVVFVVFPLWSAFLPPLGELAGPSLNVASSLWKGEIKHTSPAALQSQRH